VLAFGEIFRNYGEWFQQHVWQAWGEHHGLGVLFYLFTFFVLYAVVYTFRSPLWKGWLAFGKGMQFIVEKMIILTVIAFGTFIIVGGLRRLFGADPFKLKLDKEKKLTTYWEPRARKEKTVEDYERSF